MTNVWTRSSLFAPNQSIYLIRNLLTIIKICLQITLVTTLRLLWKSYKLSQMQSWKEQLTKNATALQGTRLFSNVASLLIIWGGPCLQKQAIKTWIVWRYKDRINLSLRSKVLLNCASLKRSLLLIGLAIVKMRNGDQTDLLKGSQLMITFNDQICFTIFMFIGYKSRFKTNYSD